MELDRDFRNVGIGPRSQFPKNPTSQELARSSCALPPSVVYSRPDEAERIMKRSVGITISAVIVFLCSGAALVPAASLLVVLSFDPQTFQSSMKYPQYSTVISLFAFAIWGVASGVGLLNLRSW